MLLDISRISIVIVYHGIVCLKTTLSLEQSIDDHMQTLQPCCAPLFHPHLERHI